MDLVVKEREVQELGFSVLDDVFTDQEVEDILAAINRTDSTKETFRKSDYLFAIRQFLKEVPETIDLIFNNKLKHIVKEVLAKIIFWSNRSISTNPKLQIGLFPIIRI